MDAKDILGRLGIEDRTVEDKAQTNARKLLKCSIFTVSRRKVCRAW